MAFNSYIDGDDSKYQDAVVEFMSDAERITKSIMRDLKIPSHMSDDLVAAAYLALCESLPKARDAECPRKYLAAAIYRSVESAWDKERGQTRSSARRHGRYAPTSIQLFETASVLAISDQSDELVIEDILACCETDEHAAIVRKRLDGMSVAEICASTQLSDTTVRVRLHDVYSRYMTA